MPSSKYLIDRLLQPIDFATATSMVQLGVGTGCITRAILERMGPTCSLTCIEVDQEFVETFHEIDDERLKVFLGCATDLKTMLQGAGISEVDHIVSSVPLTILDAAVADQILDAAHSCLRPGGKFLQYQYSLTYLRRLTQRYGDVRVGFTLRNIPPAFTYECVNAGVPAAV